MTIGTKLKNLRLKHKKTLKEQSARLGVSLNSVYRWEHDLATPRKSVLKRISEYYGVPLEWLLHESSENNPMENASEAVQPESSIEWQLIKMFRNLTENNKYKILGYVERICIEEMEQKMR